MSEGTESQKFASLRALGLTSIGVILYIILADAAIETFLAGAPVRWVAAGVVAAYGAATVLLWRRIGWAAKATISVFVLLGLLALAAWLPEGVTRGVTLLRQPTSTVLAMVTALAVGASGLALVRSGFLPPAGRWAVGIVAAYAVAGFLYGAATNTPYPDLLHGGSLWSRLPFWLQGAFLGAFVILPTMLALHFVGALSRARNAGSRVWAEIVTLSLVLVVAVAGFKAPGGPAAPAKALSRAEVAARMEKLFPALEAAMRELPRDTFDAKALVDKTGRDPAKLFEWVRDNTFLVPYRGLLRGETGVLMDRLGNSLDRAVLLYALLRAAGQEVRLAHGTLSGDQATRVLQAIRSVPARWAPASTSSSPEPLDKRVAQYARQYQLDPAELRNRINRLNAKHQRKTREVTQRAGEQTRALTAAVGKPQTRHPSADPEALRDHWWVQWQQGVDWVDLDPTLPDAKPGQVLTEVTDTKQPVRLTDLGADLLHLVEIRVVVEFWEEGRLKEVPVLSQALLPAGLFGTRVALRHAPVAWPQDLNPVEAAFLQRLKTVVLAQREWVPVLVVGSESIVKSAFTDSGEVRPAETSLLGRGAEGAARRVEELLGGSGRRSSPSPRDAAGTPTDDRLTAEWIEYEIRSPGQPVRTIRREVFDLIGPAARQAGAVPAPRITEARRLERGLALLGETEILLQVSQLSTAHVKQVVFGNLLANRKIALELVQGTSSANSKEFTNRLGELTMISGQLYGLALARREWSEVRDDVYFDHPNILTEHVRLTVDPQDRLFLLRAFDIVVNNVAVRPGAGADPFLIRLEQGVVDTNAEAQLAVRGGRTENTAEIFASSRRQGTEWVTVRATSDGVWQRIDVPKDVRTRIERDLAAGYAVVVPSKLPVVEGRAAVGWWRVNPTTGHTLGIGERGWGTAVEYTLVKKIAAVGAAISIVKFGYCVGSQGGLTWGCFTSWVCSGADQALAFLGLDLPSAVADLICSAS